MVLVVGVVICLCFNYANLNSMQTTCQDFKTILIKLGIPTAVIFVIFCIIFYAHNSVFKRLFKLSRPETNRI